MYLNEEIEDDDIDQRRYFIQDQDNKESDKSITKNYYSSTKTGTKKNIKPLIRKSISKKSIKNQVDFKMLICIKNIL